MRKLCKLFSQKALTRNSSCQLADSVVGSQRLKSILNIRKSPKQVHRLGVQSEMLAALPIVQKTQEKEREWRMRSLEGSPNNRIFIKEEIQQSHLIDAQHKTATETPDASYYAIMTSGICGLIIGFYVIDFIFEDPSGVRLLYDPNVGFLSTIEKFEARTNVYSDLLANSIDLHLKNVRAG